jgi:hypothetical protein
MDLREDAEEALLREWQRRTDEEEDNTPIAELVRTGRLPKKRKQDEIVPTVVGIKRVEREGSNTVMRSTKSRRASNLKVEDEIIPEPWEASEINDPIDRPQEANWRRFDDTERFKYDLMGASNPYMHRGPQEWAEMDTRLHKIMGYPVIGGAGSLTNALSPGEAFEYYNWKYPGQSISFSDYWNFANNISNWLPREYRPLFMEQR